MHSSSDYISMSGAKSKVSFLYQYLAQIFSSSAEFPKIEIMSKECRKYILLWYYLTLKYDPS